MTQSKKKKIKQEPKKIIIERPVSLKVYYIIIFLVAVLTYANTINHGYVLDDYSVIKENYVVKKGIDGISTIFKTGYRYGYWNSPDNLYRPLPLVLYALEWHFSPDNPSVGHLMNILWYSLLCLLLFKLLVMLLKQYSIHIAFIAVLLFAVHPIHTEVVANIKSRDEIMAFAFTILTAILFLKYFNKNSSILLITALFSFLFALLSKESAITFLVILPITFYFFTNIPTRVNVFYTLLLLIPTLIFFAMRHRAIGDQIHLSETSMIDNLLVAAPNFVSYYATAIKILGLYLWKLMIPYPLACDYSYNQIPIVDATNVYFILSLFVHLAMFIFAVLNFKKKSFLAYTIWFYLISMSVNSNIFVMIGTSFGERLMFVPSFAFVLAVSYSITSIFNNSSYKSNITYEWNRVVFSKVMFISLLLIIPYFYLTVKRNKDWKSSLTLYEADIKKSPNSAHMNYYYGLEVMKEKSMKDGQVVKPEYLDTAIFYFTKARQIIPTYADAYDQLGLAYFRKGDWDKSLAYYDTCLTLAPGKSITYSNMGVIYFQRQQYEKALELYEKVVRLDPKFADGWFNLGSTYGTLGKYDEAISSFKKCIEFNPEKAEAYYFIGITYRNLKDEVNAQNYLNKAYKLNPALKSQ